MNKNKQKILPVCVVLAAATCTQSLAATLNVPKINIGNNTVEISGNIEESKKKIELIVLNPNGTLESFAEKPDEPQYSRVIYSDEEGNFSHTFKLNLDGIEDSGTYSVYVGGASVGGIVKSEFYYASEDDVAILIEKIVKATSAQEIENVINSEEDAKKLSITAFKPFNGQDKSKISNILFEMIKNKRESGEKLDFTNTEMQMMIYEAALISAYNDGRTDLVIGENGEILYDDILNISTIDKDFDVTLYEVYNSVLSDTGRSLVRKELFLKNCKNISDIKGIFITQVILKGLTNSEKSGFAHIDKILTPQNSNAVGLKLPADLTDDNKIEIKEHDGYESIDELQKKINSFSKSDSSSGGTSSSSNKTSSSGSKITSTGNVNNYVIDNTHKPSENTKQFDDMENYSWAEEAVEELYKKGVINGITANKFAPSGILTREQAVKILCAAKGIEPQEGESGFEDVDKNAWYSGYVLAAKNAGIINGISDTKFGVGQYISRQDLAVMIDRTFKIEGRNEENNFSDFEQISDYAKAAVSVLNSKNIIAGYPDNTFRPLEKSTRAETAVIIYRILGGNA